MRQEHKKGEAGNVHLLQSLDESGKEGCINNR